MRKHFLCKRMRLGALLSLMLTAVLCFVAFITCNAFSLKSTQNALADFYEEANKKLSETIDSEYLVGSEVSWPLEIDIPNGDGTVKATNGVVILPNGSVESLGTLTLTQLGNYTVIYQYELDGVKDVVEKTVFVGDRLVKLSSEGGSITAVTEEQQADVVFDGNDTNVTTQKEDALIVRVSEGVSFEYSKSIDLSNVDDNGLCTLISLDYRLLNYVLEDGNYILNSTSANTCVVRVSDSYDSSKYVDLVYHTKQREAGITAKGQLSVRAYSQSQYAAAKTRHESWTEEYEYLKFYKNKATGDDYGVFLYPLPVLGKDGTPLDNPKHTAVTWKYDPVNQYVYYSSGATKDAESLVFLSPLNSDHVHGSTANTFAGFPSGKVKISIIMSDWDSTNQARVDVFRLGETYGDALMEACQDDMYHIDDVGVPTIDLGIKNTDKNSIFVAYNNYYKVPVPVSVAGAAIGSGYSVSAYVNYGTTSQFEVPIINGEIYIDRNAVYTLKYTAVNASGGIGETLLTLIAVKDANEGISLNLDENFFNGSFLSGQVITLPSYTLNTINLESELSMSITIKHAKTEIKVNPVEGKATLPYAGEYKIIYEYKDNVYSFVKEFTITAQPSDYVGFLDKVVISKYFIKGAQYTLPDITGYVLGGEDIVATATETFVSYDGGAFNKVDRQKITVTGSSTIQVKYVCSNGNKSAEIYSEVAKIVDVGFGNSKLKVKNYFIHDNFTPPADGESALKYTSDITNGNNTLYFINPIDYTDFELRYKVNAKANFKKLNIKLVDYYDPSIVYVITIENVDGIAYVSYNGGAKLNSTKNFAQSKDVGVTYKLLNNKLSVDNDLDYLYNLKEYFNSSLCYLEIELDGIYGDADIEITKVNGQTIKNTTTKDSVASKISVTDFGGNYTIGSQITIHEACVTDVLSTVLDEAVKVTILHSETREVVVDVNGVTLKDVPALRDYTFTLDKLGAYQVVYSRQDTGSKKKETKTYIINVVDNEKPVITFNKIGLTEINIKTGSNVDASFTVTDKVSETANISTSMWVRDSKTNVNYTCHDPNGIIYFNKAGKYVIYVFAKDEAGNYAYNTVTVTVQDEVA